LPRLLGMLGIVASMFFAPVAAPAEATKPLRLGSEDWRAIQVAVSKQMKAFHRDDDEAAFSLASPGVRRVFESANRFMEMVRTEYGAVYHSRSYRFLRPAMLDGAPVQPVEVVALDGAVSIAAFSMERQADRSWRISGCWLLESKQFAT
jgi:hypothetical protein